jgi:hypothetical protein
MGERSDLNSGINSQAARQALSRVRKPSAFVTRVIGANPTAQQAQILKALDQGKRRIAVRSGHGVGKSALLSWILLWWLSTRPASIIPCTAPTAHQLEDILWGEIGRWRQKMRPPFRDLLQVGRNWVRHQGAPDSWFAVGRTSRKGNPEALQGFHGEHLAFLIDEASGIDDEVFEVAEGALSTPGSLVVMAGNPTRREGAFYRAFHSDRAHWSTFCLPSSGSTLVAPEYSQRMAARYGEDSDIYRVRVLGEFPSSEPDALIGLATVEAAVRNELAPETEHPVVLGVDVARFGDDETVILRRRGPVVEQIECYRGLDTMETSGRAIKAARHHRASTVFVDVVGIGAGVADRLREMKLYVHPVNVAERAHDTERFDDLRSELWWRVRDWLESGEAVLPDDEELVAQLSTIKYGVTSNGRIRIESKRERKHRGLCSPDRADALMMTFAAPAVSHLPDLLNASGGGNPLHKPFDRELGF